MGLVAINWRVIAPLIVPRVSLSGTILSATMSNDIVAGGKTILLSLASDTWVSSGANFDAERQGIIDGLDSAGMETNGWDAERSNLLVTDVARSSNTLATITLSVLPNYFITAQEVITATVPASALVTSASPLVALETFTIQPSIVAGEILREEGGGILLESGDALIKEDA